LGAAALAPPAEPAVDARRSAETRRRQQQQSEVVTARAAHERIERADGDVAQARSVGVARKAAREAAERAGVAEREGEERRIVRANDFVGHRPEPERIGGELQYLLAAREQRLVADGR